MNYSELKSFIKQERQKSQEAKDFFGDYTHSTTVELTRLVDKWNSKNVKPVTKVVASVTKSEVVNVDEVVTILIEAVEKLKKLPSYVEQQELKELHKVAMEIEFELNQQ